ncbi:hypothetical protein JOQ06_019000 [Pogonophryne albipinna]|uniref:Uncharacterized protein n=1 Tax=Pogonophryne albipinna TaxID=1090488 RepID=A0AAD6FCK1_9TELE|nr:hypothetical protein JOQ06_019000 [Pogonophryne albipinna]
MELESYLELERGETRKITTALKKAEDLLATERLQFKQKILQDVKHQTSTNKEQQMALERMKAENQALQSELCVLRPMLCVAKTNVELELESYLELERGETRKITTALKKAEDLLATERLQFKQEILQDVKHQTSTNKEQQMALERMKEENQALQSELCVLRPMLCVAKTNVELESHLKLVRGETRKITTALKKAQDLLAIAHLQFKLEILQDVKHQTSTNKEQQMALERMKAKKDALQSELRAIRPMLCVAKTHMELESYLELERGETRKITTALKKAEDLLATERLQFKQKILQDVKHQTSTNKEQQMALERMKAENQALQNLLATERLQFKQEILQDVKHQTSTNKEQQMALERMKEENQALQSELCVLRPMLCVAKNERGVGEPSQIGEWRDQEDHNSP